MIDNHRLAYVREAPVNWCPGLGTVLANEEVTADGRSERGNFPVFKRGLKQWMMRITVYADRLIRDLDLLDWPEPIKLQQRNWIGRSEGATVSFPTDGGRPSGRIEVFTTRPDTVFGATYLVLAPEHPLVEELTAASWPPDLADDPRAGLDPRPRHPDRSRRRLPAPGRRADPMSSVRPRGGPRPASSSAATRPTPRPATQIPVFIADYVLMGYGTGAIMAVPGQDERDWEFAEAFGLPIVRTVQPPAAWTGQAFAGEGPAINSAQRKS